MLLVVIFVIIYKLINDIILLMPVKLTDTPFLNIHLTNIKHEHELQAYDNSCGSFFAAETF